VRSDPGTNSSAGENVVVGILYPPEWYGVPAVFAAAVAEIEAVDPRVEVVVERYDEPHELRSARGKPGAPDLRDRAPELTDAQRAVFERVDVAVVIDLPYDVAKVAPRLRWVQAVGAGTGQLQSAGIAEAGITLTSNAGSNSVSIGEFVIGRILQHWKRYPEIEAAQTRHEWDQSLYGRELTGSTLGLIGLGHINAVVANRAKAFGMNVLATRRSATPGATAPDVDEVLPTSELRAMLGRADAVVAAVPETPETIGLMDAAAFAAMQPGAFFCNVGRGSLVDEAALIAALESGHVGGAALDVASREPLPADDPLWDAPNLSLSPHVSTSPASLFPNLHRMFRANLERFLAGEELENRVDPDRGY
jgi:phosphoglycerate dehydrogenase-like enzyme